MSTADRLLRHLALEREAPSLDYLNRIIREHQLRVPFETLTKRIDYEPGLRRGDFMPSIEEYVDRIVSRGAGGLCWTLARGLHFLLQDLGFEASLMVMEPGHCCVRVEMPEGPHYADVGYAAPIFRAYPLFESFRLDSPREIFEYRVGEEGILVTRTPGPTKTLDPTPRTLAQLHGLVTAANDWSAPHSFLRRLAYSAYVDGVYTSLNQGTLKRYGPSGLETTEIPPEDVPALLTNLFRADPALYQQAAEVPQRLGTEAA
ncbi:MAG TPA: arylamine N-acetyltransferase [Candidatus Eisenbacteria bacterium]|nr:arylamine N-acetyltransferase [Candidatus Eisenbacteria bacterium]